MNNRYIGLVALIIWATACTKQTPEAARPVYNHAARLMVVHPSPYYPALDIRLVYNDTFRVNQQPIIYPGMLQYAAVPAGTRWLYVLLSGTYAGNNQYAQPRYLKPDASYTYIVKSDVLREDDLTPPANGYARIRVLQGCMYARPLDCMIHNGDTLAKAMDNWALTGFQTIKAGAYQFDVQDSEAPYTYKTSLQTNLESGKIYTLLTTLLPVADTSKVLIGTKLVTNN